MIRIFIIGVILFLIGAIMLNVAIGAPQDSSAYLLSLVIIGAILTVGGLGTMLIGCIRKTADRTVIIAGVIIFVIFSILFGTDSYLAVGLEPPGMFVGIFVIIIGIIRKIKNR